MVRALETIEGLRYTYEVDGETIAEGSAALVKLMADGESATMLVNGCLFLNVASFRYLDFGCEEGAEGEWVFRLHGDGSTLTLIAEESVEGRSDEPAAVRVIEATGFDPGSFVALDDEDDESEY
ncbi:MAG: hypothetical protein C0418_01420 [Coriobacteriaceae bacterium]|nr:hypothetical protein [Coriobacteriaceae bacterium]